MAPARPDVSVSRLSDGTTVVVLPVQPGSERLDLLRREMVVQFDRLSALSRHQRFLGGLKELTPSTLHLLADTVDDVDHVVLVAVTVERGPVNSAEPIALAHLVRDEHAPHAAALAVTVFDEWQGRGVGSTLMSAVVATAARRGIRRLLADVLVDNVRMRALLTRTGEISRCEIAGPYLSYTIDIAG